MVTKETTVQRAWSWRAKSRSVTGSFLALGIFLTLSSPALATKHDMIVNEVLTGLNGDTSVQYIELLTTSNLQCFTAGGEIRARNTDGSLEAEVFTFPGNFGTCQAGDHILIATPNFQALAGIAPDFVFNGGLSPDSGQVILFLGDVPPSDALSYGDYTGPGAPGAIGSVQAIPGDSTLALGRAIGKIHTRTMDDTLAYGLFENSPTNFVGQTGHMGPLPVCDLNPLLVGNFLSLDFSLGSNSAFLWDVWFFSAPTGPLQLWSAGLPPLSEPLPVSIPLPNFPPIGSVGLLSLFFDAGGAVVCSDVEIIDSGAPATLPTEREIRGLFQNDLP